MAVRGGSAPSDAFRVQQPDVLQTANETDFACQCDEEALLCCKAGNRASSQDTEPQGASKGSECGLKSSSLRHVDKTFGSL